MDPEATPTTAGVHNVSGLTEAVWKAAKFVETRIGKAEICLVLGSGLGEFINSLEDRKEIAYVDIPGMPTPNVKGHSGRLARGQLHGKNVYCLSGRCHGYEGYHAWRLTYSMRLMAALGCKVVLLTNAAGGAKDGMQVPCFMALTDHMNFTHRGPLEDIHEQSFGDVQWNKPLYHPALLDIAQQVAKEYDLPLFDGTYAMASGPTYETPAEIRGGCAAGGCRAFGMSTVPEVLTANAMGMAVFAVSTITNMAAGIQKTALNHKEVQEAGAKATQHLTELIGGIVEHVDLNDFPTNRASPPIKAKRVQGQWVAPLPLLDGSVPAAQHVKEAVAFVQSKLELKDRVLSAVVLPCTMESEIPPAQHSLRIGSIPFMPLLCAAAGQGSIYAVKQEQGIVLVILSGAISGFAGYDAMFLISVLGMLGVQQVVTVVSGQPNHVCNASGGMVAAWDNWLELCTLYRPPPPQGKQRYQQATLATMMASHKDWKRGTVAGFIPGTWPTAAERRPLDKEEAAYTNQSLATSLAAFQAGMDTAVVCMFQTALEPVFHTLQELTEERPRCVLEDVLGTEVSQAPPSIPPNAATQLHQSLPFAVQAAASLIKKELDTTEFGVGLVIDQGMELKDAKICVLKVFDKLPGWPLVAGALWYVEWEGVRTLAVVNAAYPHLGIATADITFGVRVLAALHVRAILLLSPVVGTSKTLPPVVAVEDHLPVMPTHNPLYGTNHEEYGVRFPDMSEAYSKALREVIALPSVVMAWVDADPNSLHDQGAIAQLAHAYGAEGMMVGTIPHVIAARHQGMPCVGVGWTRKAWSDKVDVDWTAVHSIVIKVGEWKH